MTGEAWHHIETVLSESQQKKLLRSMEHGVLLQSGGTSDLARFSILSAAPVTTETIDQTRKAGSTIPLPQLPDVNRQTIPPAYASLPFVCGWMGYAAYELGAAIHLQHNQTLDSSTPLFYAGYYTWSYIYDQVRHKGMLIFSPKCPSALRQRVLRLIEADHHTESGNTLSAASNTASDADFQPSLALSDIKWKKSQSFSDYQQQFSRAKEYIAAGDCYQVNLAQRFEAGYEQAPVDLYFALQKKTQTPYSAFIAIDNSYTILSFSPEQFVQIRDGKAVSRPIKGTLAAGAGKEEVAQLLESSKNQAENLMIVDLIRNDLSKVCKLGSVSVPALYQLETFPNVHHLVSVVTGEIEDNVTPFDAFIRCFPGGSITGAPKKRAMEIIDELEKGGRDGYCGSVFYYGDRNDFDSNILIRSIVQIENRLYCWGGGGIVADSELEDEYQESITKVNNLTGIGE